MIKLEHTDVYGWEAAIRGMRNPMNSWEKLDSHYGCGKKICHQCGYDIAECNDVDRTYIIGDNDHELMMRLAKAGSVHAKYRRMITVTVDITAPLYWWKEFDTYKVGTVANSCSTMHKIHAKEFTLDDFSCEKCEESIQLTFAFEGVIKVLNKLRDQYNNTGDKLTWYQMIQLLPSSYNQKRTVMLNYEVLVGMYRDRRNHKLDEWHDFCDWVCALPYSEIITGDVTR